VSLGDIQAFHRWVETERPWYAVGIAVADWIRRAGETPWLAPSVPIPELSFDDRQTRVAVLELTGETVEILYREIYATQLVDLIEVRTLRG
jgi:hypothetical protein